MIMASLFMFPSCVDHIKSILKGALGPPALASHLLSSTFINYMRYFEQVFATPPMARREAMHADTCHV